MNTNFMQKKGQPKLPKLPCVLVVSEKISLIYDPALPF